MTATPRPQPDTPRTVYYVRNESTGAITRHEAVVPTLPHDRLGGTVFGFASEQEYNKYLLAARPPTADGSGR